MPGSTPSTHPPTDKAGVKPAVAETSDESSVVTRVLSPDRAAVPSDKPEARTGPATSGSPQNGATSPRPVSKSNLRWWGGCVAGAVVSLPFAWLLSYAAMLPFFIGLFFFVLFGLIIGAVIHRVAAPKRPYARPPLLIGTVIVVMFGWSFSLIKEARDFPMDRAHYVAEKTGHLGGRTVGEFHEAVATQLRQYLREHYPPGGTVGYMHWALTSGEIPKGSLEDVRMKLGQPQRRYAWAIRVVLSLGLFAFGIGSQTWALRLAQDAHASLMRSLGRTHTHAQAAWKFLQSLKRAARRRR